ncbi:MAG TPA: amidohydrolase family protein [Candidatus Anaerostipes excrementavium]|uniref:Amidohydrolase family protein n=1 Tax=Candidatus Anaerostipes excrementavium TaxID=2838463 RepID=A0A9D2BAS1_9FIRM|nr:amidohydrolase family protein [uncultured Anaerostipes sp.]HIX68562.1 amidohydrolase family protein [Candidatus Anaerostipes excrementavium]
MRIDAHVHIAVKEGENPMARPENVIRSMDENGIDKIVCFTFGTGLDDQKRLAEAVAPYRDRMIPLAYVGPREKDCDEQLLYCLDELDFQGVKLHPYVSNFCVADVVMLRPIFEILEERKSYAVIHCASEDFRNHPSMFERLGNCFPHVLIQMAHMGEVMSTKYAVDVAKRVPNIYLDTAICSYVAVNRALANCPEKVFMGCDFPFYKFEMEIHKQLLVAKDTGKKQEIENIMGGNFTRIFDIDENNCIRHRLYQST